MSVLCPPYLPPQVTSTFLHLGKVSSIIPPPSLQFWPSYHRPIMAKIVAENNLSPALVLCSPGIPKFWPQSWPQSLPLGGLGGHQPTMVGKHIKKHWKNIKKHWKILKNIKKRQKTLKNIGKTLKNIEKHFLYPHFHFFLDNTFLFLDRSVWGVFLNGLCGLVRNSFLYPLWLSTFPSTS